jgi:Flp pilus assembly protein protease CpaA
LFIVSTTVATSIFEACYFYVIVSICVVIVVYDIRHYIIPDSLTVALTAVASTGLVYQVCTGTPYQAIAWTIGAALFATSFFYMLWFVSKGRWIGFGDVKLAFPLVLMVKAALAFSMVVFSFWIGTAVSLVLVSLAKVGRGKLCYRLGFSNLTIKSVVPFAPFLITGCLLTLFTQLNVLTIFTFMY